MKNLLKRILVMIALVCITNTLSAQLTLTGMVEASDLTITTSITSAAITTTGGISVGTSAYIGGNLSVVGSVYLPNLQITSLSNIGSLSTTGTGSVSVGSGGLIVNSSGISVTGTINAYGLTVGGSIAAAAITTSGGLSVGTTAYIGGNLSVVGSATATGLVTAQDFTTAGTGSVTVGSGGLSVGSAGISVTGTVNAYGLTVGGSVNAAALTTSGGISVGTTAYIGGNLSVVGSATTTGLVTAQDFTTAGTGSIMVGSGGLAVNSSGLSVTGTINAYGLTVGGSITGAALTTTGGISVGTSAYIGGNMSVIGSFKANQVSADIRHSIDAAVSAAGTNQGTATLITNDINAVTTVAAGTGVILNDDGTLGGRITISNRGANPLRVYPPSGAQIDAQGNNVAIVIPVNGSVNITHNTSTQWYTSGYDGPAAPYFQSGGLASKVAPQTITGTTETQILGVTIPANTTSPGTTFQIRLTAYSVVGNASTNTFRIRYGTTTLTGNVVCTLSPTGTAVNNVPFSIDGLVTIYTITASGTVAGGMTLSNNTATSIANSANTVSQPLAAVTLDSTADKIIEITWQGGNAATSIRIANASIAIVKL